MITAKKWNKAVKRWNKEDGIRISIDELHDFLWAIGVARDWTHDTRTLIRLTEMKNKYKEVA